MARPKKGPRRGDSLDGPSPIREKIAETPDSESDPAPVSVTSTPLSARFDAGQRDLIERAAAASGRTTAQFLRLASLERAAHVLNIGGPTRFDFYGIAARLAAQLLEPTVYVVDYDGSKMPIDELQEPVPSDAEMSADRLTRPEFEKLQQASELGGAEFWRLVFDMCASKLAPNEASLPDPIDPKRFARS